MNGMAGSDMVGELSRQVLKMEAEIEELKRENHELKSRMEKSQATSEIGRMINQVNDISRTIAKVVEVQPVSASATDHVASDADRSGSGMAQTTLSASQEDTFTQKAAAELALMANELHSLMAQFKC